MARWLQIQLAKGKLPEGGRLFSEASSAEMWAPQTIEPIGPALPGLEEMTPNFQQYALGWEVRDYGGAKIIWHSGGVFGFVTVVVLIPEKNVGFAITQNSEDGQARFGLMYELLDHYLGRPKKDWPALITKVRKERFDAARCGAQRQGGGSRCNRNRRCRWRSMPVAMWMRGTAPSPSGPIAKGLTINFTNTPNMGGRLQHWQYDTFIARFDDPGIEPAYVTFGLGAEGKVERDHDEAGVAACRFQLRLSGSAFHTGGFLTCAVRCIVAAAVVALSSCDSAGGRARPEGASRARAEGDAADRRAQRLARGARANGKAMRAGRWTCAAGWEPDRASTTRISPGCGRAWSADNSGPSGCRPICRGLNRSRKRSSRSRSCSHSRSAIPIRLRWPAPARMFAAFTRAGGLRR